MPRDLMSCVIVNSSMPATKAYGEALARTYGMDCFTEQQVSYLSLSRYQLFFLAIDPSGLLGSYLTHLYPGHVYGLAVASDGKMLVRQLAAVKRGDTSMLLVPSTEDANSLLLATKAVRAVPVLTNQGKYAAAIYGLHAQDPNWLRVVTQFGKTGQMFCMLAPIDQEMLDTLGNFPVSFAMIPAARQEEALLQSEVLICADVHSSDQVVAKARGLGKQVFKTSEWASHEDPFKELQQRALVADNEISKLRVSALSSDWRAPNNLQIGGPQERLNRLLVKFPTRGRKAKFLSIFEGYVRNLSGRNQVTFLVTVDDDDPEVDAEELRRELVRFEQGDTVLTPEGKLVGYEGPDRVEIKVISGTSKNKIDAVNRDMEFAPEFDALLLASDDMDVVQWGYDDVILQAMERYFPSTDGVLWFNDGYTGKRLNTLVCMGRAYYERFGFIYHPDYVSLWCDNEFMKVASRLGRQAYIDWVIIRHEHPANNAQVSSDELYNSNEKWFNHDKATFERRWPEFQQAMPARRLLSVLIPTLVKRRGMRQALVNKMMEQLKALHAEELVEFLLDEDRGERTIGIKRTELLQRATGEYIVFIDDDDDLDDSFMELTLACIADGSVDCVTSAGVVINDSSNKCFVHSLRYTEYHEDDRLYYRPPNHINIIRQDIAKQFPFPSRNFAEDFDFSIALQQAGALKSERFIPLPLYIYRPLAEGASSTVAPGELAETQAKEIRPAAIAQFSTGPVKAEAPQLGQRRSAARTRKTRRL